jgi:hypothetical protein
MSPNAPGNLPLRPFPFHGAEVTAVVTTRHGGVSTGVYDSLNLGDHVGDDHSNVVENRRRVASAVGVDRLTVADQTHGARVAVIGASLAGRGHDGAADSKDALPDTDAMVTNLPGAALAVIVADCAPVVLFDPVRRAVGVAHCGRPGTVRGTLPATIDALGSSYGSRPGDLLVGIGPAIGRDSYEIGSAEAAEVAAAFPGTALPETGAFPETGEFPEAKASLLRPTRPGHSNFDILGALRSQLRAAGVPDANVHPMGIDTRTSTGEFFSDRAARPCGRFMAIAMLPAQP